MYERREKILGVAPSGRNEASQNEVPQGDEGCQKREGACQERPSPNGGPPTGVLTDTIAYGFERELSAILNRLSAAMAELPPGAGAREHIVAAVQAAERTGHLNRQLLAHAGRERSEARPLDVNALVRETVELLELDCTPNVTVCLDLDGDLPAVDGDPEQVQRAIGNLLTNAAEAIGNAAGTITVVTKMTTVTDAKGANGVEGMEPTVAGRFPDPGHYVTLQVSDDGCGMEEETQARMFAPLFSTRGVGRGLGLTAVLGAVRAHGGGIDVTSEPRCGTAVTLFLPHAGEVPGADGKAVGLEEKANGSGRRCVLVIDDELDVREAVTDILTIKGLDVLTAADGKSGLQRYRDYRDEVDLVLLDLSMPKMGGEETCRRLRDLDPEVRVLITSGYDRDEAHSKLSRLGADGFLAKPYDMEKLLCAVFELVGEGVAASAT